jgi:hypothetical protein
MLFITSRHILSLLLILPMFLLFLLLAML